MLRLSDEQAQLQNSVRRFLSDKSPELAVRALMETDEGYDPQVWRSMARDMGLQSVIVPERFGGLGLGQQELFLLFEEMGRVLLCAPFFSTVALATNALLMLGDEQAMQDYLPGIAAGETIATLALMEGGGGWDEGGVALAARESAGGWRLDGEKAFVIDGFVADLILVVARADSGVCVCAVASDAPGLTRTPRATMDQTRKLADLTFADTPARLIGKHGRAWPAIARTLDLAAVALSAEQIGGLQRLLEMSVEYAKFRVQFGRAIGSFQAIKHKCADMLLELESARAAAHEACRLAAADADGLSACASLAKAYCSEAYFNAAATNIQVHGGIGFTWENPAHLYFKRAKSSEMLLGTPDYHREKFLVESGL